MRLTACRAPHQLSPGFAIGHRHRIRDNKNRILDSSQSKALRRRTEKRQTSRSVRTGFVRPNVQRCSSHC